VCILFLKFFEGRSTCFEYCLLTKAVKKPEKLQNGGRKTSVLPVSERMCVYCVCQHGVHTLVCVVCAVSVCMHMCVRVCVCVFVCICMMRRERTHYSKRFSLLRSHRKAPASTGKTSPRLVTLTRMFICTCVVCACASVCVCVCVLTREFEALGVSRRTRASM